MNLGLINTWMFGGAPLTAMRFTMGAGGTFSVGVFGDPSNFGSNVDLLVLWNDIEETITIRPGMQRSTTISRQNMPDASVVQFLNPEVLSGILVYGMDLVKMEFPKNLPILQYVVIDGLVNLRSFKTYPTWVSMQDLYLSNLPLIEQLDFFAEWTDVRNIGFSGTAVTSTEIFSSWLLFQMIIASDNTRLSSFNVPVLDTGLQNKRFEFRGCNLQNCNEVLIALDGHIGQGSTIALDGGTNSIVSGAGITAANNLSNAGVQVSYNS